jgi:hypothetical protein
MAAACDACNICNTGGTVTLVQGYAKTFCLYLFTADDCTCATLQSLPFDLTTATEITAAFPATIAGPPVTLTKSGSGGITIIGSPVLGHIDLAMTAIKSALLQVNPSGPQGQDLQISVVNPSGTFVFLYPNYLDIVAPPYGVV